VVKKKEIVFVDTNIFVIDLRYRRDKKYRVNQEFLEDIAGSRTGITGIFNLLELCGILSFNLNERQLRELYHYFPRRYRIEVLPSLSLGMSIPQISLEKIFQVISRKLPLGDALIIALLEIYLPPVSIFVSWDIKHFKEKLSIPVLTPEEYLRLSK
jgi:predicted nucleic acid-binding protein